MTPLEATVEIVKAALAGGTASNWSLLVDQAQRQAFLQGIESVHATIKRLESK